MSIVPVIINELEIVNEGTFGALVSIIVNGFNHPLSPPIVQPDERVTYDLFKVPGLSPGSVFVVLVTTPDTVTESHKFKFDPNVGATAILIIRGSPNAPSIIYEGTKKNI